MIEPGPPPPDDAPDGPEPPTAERITAENRAETVRPSARKPRESGVAATHATPLDPATSPWLGIAAPLGRIATIFLVAANVLLLFAPLLFLFEASSYVDPTAPGSGLLFLLADPAHLVSISDLVMVIGVLVLCGAVLLVLVGLLRGDRRVSADAAIAGVVCFACLVAWVPTMLLAGGTGRGRVEGVEAVAASGGWSIASLVLLVAALAYLAFALRADRGARPVRVASYWWPVYAAVNVVGAAAIAGFFGGDASDLNALSIGLILRLTLVPVLGVVAYSDLHDRIQRWAYLPVVQPPQVRRPRVVRPSPRPRVVEPSPPPPEE